MITVSTVTLSPTFVWKVLSNFSGLPLVTKPMRMRLRLIRDAFDLMLPGAPFVQFTYSVASPLPRRLGGFTVEKSERIWMNIPPARVWVYRKI